MKNVRHRPCVICATGHFKCNARSTNRTCSPKCSKIYAQNAFVFSDFDPGWYAKNDIMPQRRSGVLRIGNSLMFKSMLAKKAQTDDQAATTPNIGAPKMASNVTSPNVIPPNIVVPDIVAPNVM